MICDVCGEECEEVPTSRHNRAWMCRNCNVKYFDRDKEEYKPHVYAVWDSDQYCFIRSLTRTALTCQ